MDLQYWIIYVITAILGSSQYDTCSGGLTIPRMSSAMNNDLTNPATAEVTGYFSHSPNLDRIFIPPKSEVLEEA